MRQPPSGCSSPASTTASPSVTRPAWAKASANSVRPVKDWKLTLGSAISSGPACSRRDPVSRTAAPEYDSSFKPGTELAPERQAVLSRLVEQHSRIARCACQVSYPQRDRACRQGKGVTQRQCVPGRPGLFDAHFRRAHRLIREPLQPQHAREEGERRRFHVNLEANNIPSVIGGGIASQHLPQMAPRTVLVAKEMLGQPHDVLAE